MKTSKFYIYALAALGMASCKPSFKTVTPSHGTADFSRYIAVGNSLTAGYADGGLSRAGQLNSYPSIIAAQMQTAGGGVFNQPLFTTAQANGTGYLKLTGFNADGTPILTTVTSNLAYTGQVAVVPGFGNVNLLTKYTDDIENYGVPGIKLIHLTYAPYGDVNPYFERLLPGTSPLNTTTYLSFITAKPFTFFTNWLGNNDALGYATGGGVGDALTDKTTFAQLYTLLVGSLTANGAKGVCSTIPDVTTIPYFSAVTTTALIAGVQKASPTANVYISARTTTDPTNNTHATRIATANDLITLTFLSSNPSKLGVTLINTVAGPLPYGVTPLTPIDDQYVLDQNEVALTKDYVLNYNATIKAVAASKGLAVFDAYTFLTNIKTSGLVIDGLSLNSNYISGGIFSLDGVHLTPRGYAIVANEIIKVINSQYGSSVPLANVTNYNGVTLP